MGSKGTVNLKSIWAMLDECAPGHTRHERDHNWIIRFGEKVYPALPNGPHGKSNPPIQIGHVRKMVRALEIGDCAGRLLEILR